LPTTTATSACHTFSPRLNAMTPTEKKNRYAFVPTHT
jgi:hypothetical protein